jgi:chemotaxis signal transduction protein
MEKTAPGLNPDFVGAPALMIFSLGGRRLAARTDEMAGVRLWGPTVAIPSRTAYINRLLRHGDEVLPVYDLGARLHLRPVGALPLCLIAKHQKGMLAVCIDAELPKLRPLAGLTGSVTPAKDADVLGTCQSEGETIPVISLATLGHQTRSEQRESRR